MAMVLQTRDCAGKVAECRYESRPNCSLDKGSRKIAFWLIASVCFAVASGFCLLGYWPVMPFAGLEIGILAWAFEAIGRREADFEQIVIAQDRVELTTCRDGKMERRTMNRFWTRVILVCERPRSECRVFLSSAGKDTEVGRHLSDEERRELARTLKQQLGT
jgi:uncharacterized membrane protein